jgi:NAD(P)-dependent dehydrogenase (short-subunit alcohol dehydrogenase family)
MTDANAASSAVCDSFKKDKSHRGTVVISGASRGLGAELVGQACDLGYFVFALVRGSAPANTANICFVTVDLSSEASIGQVTLKHDCVTRSSFHL